MSNLDRLRPLRLEGRRTTFTPGLIPDDFRATNRPTYQQALELAPRG